MSGILFVLSAAAVAENTPLFADLFDEGQWIASRREALRARAADPDDARAAFYFHAAGMHGGIDFDRSVEALSGIAEDPSADPSVAAAAHYQLGLDAWARGDTSNTWHHLSRAFRHYHDEDMHKNAGCLLYMTQWDDPDVVPSSDAALVTQLRTLRPLWTRERINEALAYKESRQERKAIGGRPGMWVVSFYRSQIGPAIGSRCSLHPSCSEYFLQASRDHGLMGIPMIGDRLVREPGVVSRAERVVTVNGTQRIADPVEDHVHD